MRIVSWNMNQAHHAGSHHEAWDFLRTLNPDIALVQEAVVGDDSGFDVRWKQAWDHLLWGSAILSRVGDLELVWEDRSRGAVVVAQCSVPSFGQISIASIHARIIDHRVIPALRLTFEAVRAHLGRRFIVGGDLNTARAAALAWPENGHAEFWSDVEARGFRELLPFNGEERQSYWREWLQNKPPSIGNSLQDDHVFVDAETIGYAASCLVLGHEGGS